MKNKGISRRDFFRLSAAGLGTLVLPGSIAEAMAQTAGTDQKSSIPMRTLGRTGVRLPILSMGVMRADNPNVVRAAYNSGIFHFDTAHGYQNGRNEEMLGNFFADKPRDSFFIGTKVSVRYPFAENFEADLERDIDISLSRLKMKYMDIFYVHGISGVDEINDPRLIAAVQKVKDSGKARFVGFSTHAQNPAQIDAAIKAGIYDVILMSYNFKLGKLPETDAALARAHEAGIGIVAMKTMTGAVEDAAGNKKIDAQACLKWVWQNENITTAIPGFSNFDELDTCLAAAGNVTLTDTEKQYLAGLRDSEMLFCKNCGECGPQCPKGLPIPDIMRAYMYAYGYKQAQLSKDALVQAGLSADCCAGCDECAVKCSSGFDVGAKIAAIVPVINTPVEFLS